MAAAVGVVEAHAAERDGGAVMYRMRNPRIP